MRRLMLQPNDGPPPPSQRRLQKSLGNTGMRCSRMPATIPARYLLDISCLPPTKWMCMGDAGQCLCRSANARASRHHRARASVIMCISALSTAVATRPPPSACLAPFSTLRAARSCAEPIAPSGPWRSRRCRGPPPPACDEGGKASPGPPQSREQPDGSWKACGHTASSGSWSDKPYTSTRSDRTLTAVCGRRPRENVGNNTRARSMQL